MPNSIHMCVCPVRNRVFHGHFFISDEVLLNCQGATVRVIQADLQTLIFGFNGFPCLEELLKEYWKNKHLF